jgi:P-type Cu+ transporter
MASWWRWATCAWLQRAQPALNGLAEEVDRLQGEAKTVMVVAVDGAYVRGVIAVADTVKEGSLEAIRSLQSHGLEGCYDHRR